MIIEIRETKVTITLESSREYTREKINTNIEDIFGWEATRNHRAFTWGLPGTDKLNTYNIAEGKGESVINVSMYLVFTTNWGHEK